MREYQRPAIPAETYRDERGEPIRYGRRWGSDGPPEEAYSRTSNLERFAPLHTVADALVDWLQHAFDVTVDRDPSVARDLIHIHDDIVAAVRLTPNRPDAAPITVVSTGFPGVTIHAGAAHDFVFPVCGCDACDDDVTDLLDELEWTVRTVIAGGYSEGVDRRTDAVSFRLAEDGVGSRSGSGRLQDLPADRAALAEVMLRALPADGQWQPWPAAAESPGDPTVA